MLGVRSLRTYFEAAALAALAISLGVNHWQHRANAALERTRLDTETKLRAAIEANASQADALSSLEKANGELVAACAANDTARSLAAEAERFRASVAETSKRIWNAGSKDYASPKCADVLALDVAAACPAIVRGLRERASRRASADGTSAGARGAGVTD